MKDILTFIVLVALLVLIVFALISNDHWRHDCIARGGVPLSRDGVCMKGETI